MMNLTGRHSEAAGPARRASAAGSRELIVLEKVLPGDNFGFAGGLLASL